MNTVPQVPASPKTLPESPRNPAPSPVEVHYSPTTTAPRSSMWGSVIGWLVVIGLGAAAWHYRATLLPLIEPLVGGSKPPAPKPARVVPVSTAVVVKRDMPIYLNGLGTVTAFKTVTLRSRVEGELTKVAFSEGQIVHEGDLLAEIDPRPFEVQLAQAEGQLARDEATLKTAKATLSRYEGLVATKSIAAQQYDDQASIVQQTMATLQSDEALVANAKLQLTYSKIVAPISGRIGLRLVDQGNIVRANDPNGLAVITQLQPIALVFTIPQDDIARVQRRSSGDQVLEVQAYDRDFKQKLATGKLLAIDNQVDATTGTVRLKSEFPNEDGMLFPNQFVNARLLVDTKRDAITVPSAAVQRGPTTMFVYVVTSDDTVELRNVIPGPSEGGETTIESGLEPGEIVVTDGLDKLQPKAKVAPREKEKAGKKEKGEPKSGQNKPDKKSDAKPAAEEGKSRPHPEPHSQIPASSSPAPERATAKSEPKSETENSAPAASGDSKPKSALSCGESEPESSDDTADKVTP